MFLLIDENNKPFAIAEDNTNMRIEKAISEEFLLDDVGLIGEVILPDWGEKRELEYSGTSDDGEEVVGKIEIMKIVKY